VIVVLDTNVLASGAIARPGSTLALLVDLMRIGAYQVAISQPILDELARTLATSYFSQRITASDSALYLLSTTAAATAVPITVAVHGVATHPEDDLILATALSAQADYLVTGDSQLQGLGAYRG
jgi:putative PIN family toxin of toxin-antitoxin system